MKYVVLREDDISYFTKPGFLEKLYAPLFEQKKPINFSIIPNVSCSITTPSNEAYRQQENLLYDPLIPPQYRGSDVTFPLDENKEICEYLKSLQNCEFAQHGYTHELIEGVPEFDIQNEIEIRRRACIGRKMLEGLFGDIAFFVPPWDRVSSQCIDFLKSSYKGVSLSVIDREELGRTSLPAYVYKKLMKRKYMFLDRFLLIEHYGRCLSRFKNADSNIRSVLQAVETEKIVVIVNHHWEYFYDWNGPDLALFHAWQTIIDHLLGKDDLKFLSFSQLHSLL